MTTGRPDRASLDDPLHCRSVLSVRHTYLLDLVLAYFWRWNTLLTVGHHALSLSLSVWWVATGIHNRTPLEGWLLAAGTAVIVFLVFVLPPHEALHVFSYRALGVRDIQWSLPWRPFAMFVLAHNVVLDRSRFLVLAALPSFCITGGLLAHVTLGVTVAFPALTLSLLYLGGTAGDAALLHDFWIHRSCPPFTYDDAEAGLTRFVERIE